MKNPPKSMQGASKSTGKALITKAFLLVILFFVPNFVPNNYKSFLTLSNSSFIFFAVCDHILIFFYSLSPFDENKSAEKVNASRKTISAHTVLLHS